MLTPSMNRSEPCGRFGPDKIALSTSVLPLGALTRGFLADLRNKRARMLLLLGLMVVLAVVAVTQGAYEIRLGQLVAALTGSGGQAADVVLWKIRLPRIVAALVVGWGLAMAGLGVQSLLKNPLGSPSTLGISQGAAFGAAAAIVLFGQQLLSVTFCAFVGAMGATAVIMTLASLRRLSPEAIILAGVALSSLFGSATVLVQYLASETELAVVVFWTFGDVARSTWSQIGLLTVVVLLATFLMIHWRWDLNALAAGEETARGLGVRVRRVRLAGMLAAALVAALATAFHGVIAFVGLIAPHMARRLVGDNHSLLIPMSGLVGALLLLGADTLGRCLIGSGSLPVGIVTSFMGAPMFLFLLMRGRR